MSAVARAAEAGAITTSNPVMTAIHCWSGLHGIASLLICEPGFPWPPVDELVEALLDEQERGLLPRT